MITKKGVVTSAKMQGTVTVTVHRFVLHPIYKKRFRRSTKFLADANGLSIHEGDLVLIQECAPISKNKKFKVAEIVQKANQVGEVEVEKEVQEAMTRKKEDKSEELKVKSENKSSDATSRKDKEEEDTSTPEDSSSASKKSASSDSSAS